MWLYCTGWKWPGNAWRDGAASSILVFCAFVISDVKLNAEMACLNSNCLYLRVHFTVWGDQQCWVTLTIWHMTAWFKRGAALRIKPTSSLLTSTRRIKRGSAEAGRDQTTELIYTTFDESRRVNLWQFGPTQMQVKFGSPQVKGWAHSVKQWVSVKIVGTV